VGEGAEAAAGTNPDDDAVVLRFTGVAKSQDGPALSWQVRDGRCYRVYAKTSWDGIPYGTLVATVPATGGDPPWYTTTGRVADATGVGHRVHYLEVGP
jgi:hypothetical protein